MFLMGRLPDRNDVRLSNAGVGAVTDKRACLVARSTAGITVLMTALALSAASAVSRIYHTLSSSSRRLAKKAKSPAAKAAAAAVSKTLPIASAFDATPSVCSLCCMPAATAMS